jgi:hypothetical protein
MTETQAIDAPTRERFRMLAKQILHRRLRQRLTLQPWLVVLWPWSWIAKRPAVRSLVFAAAAVMVVLAIGAGSWHPLYVAKVLITGCALYLSMLANFGVARIYQRLYFRLRRVALMPEDALERWYLARVSNLLGHINLCPAKSAYTFRRSVREDGVLWAIYAANICFGIPATLQYVNRRIYPDGHLLALPAWIALAALSIVTVFSAGWLVPHALLTARFPLQLARLPVRSYPRMAGSVSLNVVGDAFLLISALFTALFLPALAVLYVGGIRPDAGTLLSACSYGIMMLSGGMLSQIALAIALRGHRQKKLVEYGFHVEQAFEQFMKNPSPDQHSRVKQLLLQRKVIGMLPATGFSFWSAAGFILLCAFNVGMLLFFWYVCGSVPQIFR